MRMGGILEDDFKTENGKLYISYPMIEALRDYEPGKCSSRDACFIPIAKHGFYKHDSSARAGLDSFRELRLCHLERDHQRVREEGVVPARLGGDDWL